MFADYIRSIIFFLVFASFVGIILPSGKYKSYINIVIGFVTMFLVFEPVGDLGDIVTRTGLELTQTSVKNSEAEYRQLIADTFAKQLREHISLAVGNAGYELTECAADIDLDTGELKSVSVTVSQRTDVISVSPALVTLSDSGEDIKKIVSDFYQLPEEHIHVTIR